MKSKMKSPEKESQNEYPAKFQPMLKVQLKDAFLLIIGVLVLIVASVLHVSESKLVWIARCVGVMHVGGRFVVFLVDGERCVRAARKNATTHQVIQMIDQRLVVLLLQPTRVWLCGNNFDGSRRR